MAHIYKLNSSKLIHIVLHSIFVSSYSSYISSIRSCSPFFSSSSSFLNTTHTHAHTHDG